MAKGFRKVERRFRDYGAGKGLALQSLVKHRPHPTAGTEMRNGILRPTGNVIILPKMDTIDLVLMHSVVCLGSLFLISSFVSKKVLMSSQTLCP